MKERIGVIDPGGRGHAVAAAYADDPRIEVVHVFPGNEFMEVGRKGRIITHPDIGVKDASGIAFFCFANSITLADVAQDDAVEAGVADALRSVNVLTVGPSREASEIEWSKRRGRELASKIGLNQPHYVVCHSQEEGYAAINEWPFEKGFVKADGLAAGKGARPAKTKEEMRIEVLNMKSFGKSGQTFLLEEWLEGDDGTPGEEVSVFAISGKIVGFAQDHKRVFDNDEGENTGGMGCVNNPRVVDPEIEEQLQEMVSKTFQALDEEGTPYNGVLYMGAMLVKRQGKLVPYLVEYNARWGDPEAEVLLPLESNLFDLSLAVAVGEDLTNFDIQPAKQSRVAVAIASHGYPGTYKDVIGKEIFGIDEVRELKDVRLYGAGVKVQEVGSERYRYFASGGRLLYVVGEGENILEARQNAYGAASMIYVEGNNGHYRKDIGVRDVGRYYQQSTR
jgi:phosphoribosylamine---glycine ligase